MSLREQAEAAYESSLDERTKEARAHIQKVLAPYDVSNLVVSEFAYDKDDLVIVFTDGDVELACFDRGGWCLCVVEGESLMTHPHVESLSHLGRLLPDSGEGA